MAEFLTLLSPPAARQKFLNAIKHRLGIVKVPLAEGLGRVLAEDIQAGEALPPFNRSTVDGYAVRATDTHGASESLPAYLRPVGEVPMGAAAGMQVERGECAVIHTGGVLPDGADAAVMLEHTQVAGGEIEILRAAAVGDNVIMTGEDIVAGEIALTAGTRLRPEELGGLAALGVVMIPARRKARVAIISSGDEVVPPEQPLKAGQVRDVNSTTLAGLVQAAGGEPALWGIVPDNLNEMTAAVREALNDHDVVVITAGSSASVRDLTAQAIGALGEPGVLVHGVNVRPGKPTILAVCGGKPVLGLPGNPASALVIARLFLLPAIELLAEERVRPVRPVLARLRVNLASQAGREDWLAVNLSLEDDGLWAVPVYGKSNQILMLARAEGLLCIPADATGMAAGDWAEVTLY